MNFTPGPDDEFLDKDVARLVHTHQREQREEARTKWTTSNATSSDGS